MLLQTSSAPLPALSALHQMRRPGDFLDCYRIASPMASRAAAEIITNFPTWAQLLVKLRGLVTTPFGLKQSGPEGVDSVGFFPVISETPDELIAGFDDKHLNFCVSTIQQDGYVYLATWVSPHNIGGRIYLATILPFHILIARNALVRVAQHSNTGQSGGDSLEAQ